MKLYICTSARNIDAYLRFREALILSSHVVLDWSPLLPPAGPHFAHEKDSDPGGHIFSFCSRACASADLVVYLGPAGQDAACELGIAFAAGVPVWGVAGPDERPGAMVAGCVSRWLPDQQHIIDELTRWRGW